MCQCNIYLIGPMGSGKSTVGRLLAQTIGYEFADSDHHVEASTGVNIPYIFEMEGEAGFRDRESRAIEELCCKEKIVLATGGGAVLRFENRQKLRENSLIFYLNVSPETQFDRVRFDQQRPLLKHDDPKSVLQQLYNVRDPLYREIADYIIYSDNIPPKIVVSGIIESILEKKAMLPEWLIGNSK
ncbi:shikimate kinase [Ignatzschineria larvae]|nr:shikimate kinase [Ignatzschineria larvae]